MKIRDGFVSNSSSSSFIISKDKLTENQISAIFNYEEIYNELPDIIKKCNDMIYGAEGWVIEEDDECVRGYTFMDNFGMYEYLSIIGVPISDIQSFESNQHYFKSPFK
jgi:hypothetical protein